MAQRSFDNQIPSSSSASPSTTLARGKACLRCRKRKMVSTNFRVLLLCPILTSVHRDAMVSSQHALSVFVHTSRKLASTTMAKARLVHRLSVKRSLGWKRRLLSYVTRIIRLLPRSFCMTPMPHHLPLHHPTRPPRPPCPEPTPSAAQTQSPPQLRPPLALQALAAQVCP